MIAEIIGVGTGPMLRDIVNADSQMLSRELSLLGIEVRYQSAVGASKQGLQQAMAEALRRSDVIITTGGLGMEPTDFTKKTICKGLGIPLELHPESFARVRAYYEAAGCPMPPEAQEQANLPQGSVVFPNNTGLAPGCAISAGDQCIICLLYTSLALIDHDDPRADRLHLGQDVGGKDDGVLLPQLLDQPADLDDLLGVEADGRLVQDHDRRRAQQMCIRDSPQATIAIIACPCIIVNRLIPIFG